MLRVILYLVVLTLLVGGATWLADHPGKVQIDWLAWRISTSLPVLALALFLLCLMMFLALRLVAALASWPARWQSNRRNARRERGYRALTDGLAAVAGGDGQKARKLAERAEKLLQDPKLTNLLAAQSASLSNDHPAMIANFEAMRARPETALAGLRGLLELATKEGDRSRAVTLAQEARKLAPGDLPLAEQLLALLLQQDQLAEAQELVVDAARHKAFTKPRADRFRALILNERSRRAEQLGDPADALAFAKLAFSNDPALTDAALRFARLQAGQGLTRQAVATLEKAWRVQPMPGLFDAYAQLQPGEAPLQRLRRLERLAAIHPDHPVTQVGLGSLALEAKLWGQARKYLTLAAERPTAMLLGLLAKLEIAEYNNQSAAQAWLAKLPLAEPDWICRQCGAHARDWHLFCENCAALDGLRWSETPTESDKPG